MLTITVRYRGRKVVVSVPSGDDEVAIDLSSAKIEKDSIKLVTLK